MEKPLFQTNISAIKRAKKALVLQQKMNDKSTFVVLSEKNLQKVYEAANLIDKAILILQEIK